MDLDLEKNEKREIIDTKNSVKESEDEFEDGK